jgi:hypothetical protein
MRLQGQELEGYGRHVRTRHPMYATDSKVQSSREEIWSTDREGKIRGEA